ncbi:MAG: B12-binding domain-containing radical SAM protein [Deltaproteobacteria bacterium]|nr:B12-binding domain-containing radical SAM protein [Deltaproteobacteria bacterium]
MKIKFIVPCWPKDSFWDVITFKFPHLSTTLLAALTPEGHQVSIHDEGIAPINFDQECDLIAITAMTPLAPRGYEIAEEYRRRGVKVVMGGMHSTWLPEEAIAHCDAVVIGEADEIWVEVVRDAARGELKRFYQQEGRTDLARLPLPRRNLLDPQGYFFENTIQTTRGCPFDCEFCSVTAMYGGTYRTRPLEEVEREVRSLRRAQAYIFFVDDNIVGNIRYARELFTMLSQYRLRWVSQGPITIAQDEELVRLMARAGCHGMFIGFESLSPENLKLMGKRTNKVEQYETGIKQLHDHGIGVHASFVFGYDYDDTSVFEKFLSFAHRTRIDGAFLPVLTPFPGTKIYQRLKKEGKILTEDWSRYDMATVVFRPKMMTVDELQEGFWWVNKEFYSLRSMVRRIFQPFAMRRSLIIFGPMNLGHWPAVRKAKRHFYREGTPCWSSS